MAKTMRKPVDKLERQQRLAAKQRNQDQRPGRGQTWDLIEDEDDTVEDYSIQSETA